MNRLLRVLPLAAVLAAGLAGPARADDAEDKAKLEAKALLQSGNAFFDKGAYGQALDLFRAAFARYPSTKVLFNIGKTLDAMGRAREAAMTFDEYLAKPDADPTRRGEILDMLRKLEPKLGKVVFKQVDAQTKITVDNEALAVSGAPARVDPGDHLVRVEKPGFLPLELTVSVVAGEEKNVDITLAPAPPADPQPTRVSVRTQQPPDPTASEPNPDSHPQLPDVPPADEQPPGAAGPRTSRFAITVRVVADHELAGAAVQPGLEIALVPQRLSVVAAATLGPNFGGFIGARARLTTGKVRPIVVAGVPLFAFDGLRAGVRAGAGVEAALAGRFSLSLEVAAEHYFVKDGDMLEATVLAPAAAINARL